MSTKIGSNNFCLPNAWVASYICFSEHKRRDGSVNSCPSSTSSYTSYSLEVSSPDLNNCVQVSEVAMDCGSEEAGNPILGSQSVYIYSFSNQLLEISNKKCRTICLQQGQQLVLLWPPAPGCGQGDVQLLLLFCCFLVLSLNATLKLRLVSSYLSSSFQTCSKKQPVISAHILFP